MSRLTAEQEAALRDAETKATPGPWMNGTDPEEIDSVRVCFFRDSDACEWCVALSGDMDDGHWTAETQRRWRADADFIAIARTLMPALLAELDAVRAEAQRLYKLACEASPTMMQAAVVPDWSARFWAEVSWRNGMGPEPTT